MPHPERVNRGRIVVPDFLFLGIEADALPNDGGFGAGRTPDWKGHFEADSEDSLFDFVGASTESVFAGELVGGLDAFLVGGDVASHV